MKQPKPKLTQRMTPRFVPLTARMMAVAAAVIIALMPFHAFLSIWVSRATGHYTAVRLWKEVLLGLLVAGCIYLLVTQPKLRAWVRRDRLVWLILGYAALLLLV